MVANMVAPKASGLASHHVMRETVIPVFSSRDDRFYTRVCVVACALSVLALPCRVMAQDGEEGSTATSTPPSLSLIDALTRKILLTEIELERFNLHYQQEVAKQGRWKGWRYAAFQETNNGLGLAGGIVGAHQRGKHLRSPAHVNAKVQEKANILPMLGSIIGASGAAYEFTVNELHDLDARRKGYSPKAARLKVAAYKTEIDRLLLQRDALVQASSCVPGNERRAEIDVIEGKILRDLRDQSLLEFERFHISARKLLAFQQTQYLFDMSKNVTNAIGCEQAYQSLHLQDRRYNFNAGVLFIVSGALTASGPIISRGVAAGVGKWHRHLLKPDISSAEAAEVAVLQQDKAALDALCSTGTLPSELVLGSIERSEIYGIRSKIFQDELAAANKARDKSKLTATQNIGSGLYVGSSKIASGILFAIPGYYPQYHSKTLRASTVTNSDLFAAGIIGLPATTYSMLDTLRIQITGEINRRKLMKKGLQKSQLVDARLKQLDDIQRRLESK